MSRPSTVILATTLTALALTPHAAAGGWWNIVQLEHSTAAAGQRVTARATVYFTSARAARNAASGGPFYVYVLHGFAQTSLELPRLPSAWWSRWSLRGAEAVRAGPVVLDVSGHTGAVRASFTVPDLRPGGYSLMFCDAGCRHPLGDIVPTPGFTIAADAATARLATRVDRLEQRLARQSRLRQAARTAARGARAEATSVGAQLRRLEQRVASAEQRPGPSRWGYAGWLVGGFSVGAGLVLALRRRRTGSACPEPDWQIRDDELEALLTSQPSEQADSRPVQSRAGREPIVR